MDMNEFKAWLDGYTQAKGGSLVQHDIDIIKQKLDEVYPVVPQIYPQIYPIGPWVSPTINPWTITY